MKTLLCVLLMASVCQARAMDEVNYWRARNGLPPIKENMALTQFAQRKAEYRAIHGYHNDHRGPVHPERTREGTGEAMPMWGWLTCCMEETCLEGGAGVAIGAGGERRSVYP